MAEERRDLEDELKGLPPNLPDLDAPKAKEAAPVTYAAPLALPNNAKPKKAKKKK